MHEDLKLCNYDYFLPKEQIASHPIYPKEAAKLLIYEREKDKVTHSHFANLMHFLPDCAIFFNDTKVIKARIYGKKESGGKIELFLHSSVGEFEFIAQIKGKVKKDEILYFEKGLSAEILELYDDGLRKVCFRQNETTLSTPALYALLEKIGHIPLPPYIKRADTLKDESDYQSIFAKNLGAVAAPTASLHFSKMMLEELKKRHEIHTLTLHIGAGTFKSVECEDIREHKMHSEIFHIDENAKACIDSKKAILGVGTTATRSIEHYARNGICSGKCDLFLHPLNRPIRQNFLLTNFHLPKSTLIMLVSAFIGREKTLALYKEAIELNYRFYSYGDAMLII
ncbi:tRNA preQ1(34) S-adenosylmethionine ribosyltransferase-isomerase QueA [Campylobacter helveticus]|uniref:tRNA preQ1(34) S-adenosylmethionine ribosyltransferase-isomerase QueA n=1 Tax=Campylobacter helveticus TaxID=28898 RepID=UPI00214A229F|nr:tRNA preQ1(34) S-adenosylmethionine ribosyltransferase-isomerase QueA [Campylobacter helveticus]MCR2063971.1 tRNA preQ1(34) S-adenosylmethionine ribosyltransferase-isomerase QueA [Campylobacter helveticus]